ncbi:hypothetical protein F2Q69_00028086 [Brassica cretica]|uniref:Uncharacterized protein n=1 Tax=Brassica cretica TaxID=69181 RepID=A0A8S9RWP0_BRACR|nr:hypothetical protein F2Q69_00028086 [Brassica cretica]
MVLDPVRSLQETSELAMDLFIARIENMSLKCNRRQLAMDGSPGLSTDANYNLSPIRSQFATDSREHKPSQAVADSDDIATTIFVAH